MKILVTGGLGYIGSHTVVELLENNYELSSIFNPLLGSQNYFSEYHLNIPYFENCNETDEKCQCPEKLDTYDNFQEIYPEINVTDINKTKIPHRIIKEINPINLKSSLYLGIEERKVITALAPGIGTTL